MPISYSIDRENRCIHETWTGLITAKDLGDHQRRVLTDPVVMVIRRTIVDLRGCRILFSGEQLAELMESVALPLLNGKSWRSAIVVGDPAQKEITQQYHVLAESYSRDSVFDTPEAAMAWMQTQSP
ncbi:MAG TPA: hypothetical protein VF461_06240 [Gemmatimonadaceae bacterium]